MAPKDVRLEFSRRYRRHLLILPMFLITLGIPVVLSGINLGAGTRIAGWLTLAFFAGACVYAIRSLIVNLRCPYCERRVWFYAVPPAECRHCAARLR